MQFLYPDHSINARPNHIACDILPQYKKNPRLRKLPPPYHEQLRPHSDAPTFIRRPILVPPQTCTIDSSTHRPRMSTSTLRRWRFPPSRAVSSKGSSLRRRSTRPSTCRDGRPSPRFLPQHDAATTSLTIRNSSARGARVPLMPPFVIAKTDMAQVHSASSTALTSVTEQ